MKNTVIALGANLGEPLLAVRAAVAALAQKPQIRIGRVSSLYRTKPVGYLNQPDFINAVLTAQTELSAHDLLRLTQALEQRFGRVRSFADAPRTLDLDIIDFAGESLNDAELTLPHPRALARAFVMVPLAEIAPEYRIAGVRAREAAAALPRDGILRIAPAPALADLSYNSPIFSPGEKT